MPLSQFDQVPPPLSPDRCGTATMSPSLSPSFRRRHLLADATLFCGLGLVLLGGHFLFQPHTPPTPFLKHARKPHSVHPGDPATCRATRAGMQVVADSNGTHPSPRPTPLLRPY